MIGTGEDRVTAVFLNDAGSAVPADVIESINRSFLIFANDDGLSTDLCCDGIPRLSQFV
jgi:hypothetical protein